MDVDVIILGSGQAGVPLASRLAEAGKRVLVVERGELGGTCVNTGCTPTKTMIASARSAHVARTAGRLGVKAGPVEVDLGAVVERKDAIVKQWREGVARRLHRGDGLLQTVRGHGRFTGDREVVVGNERHRASTVIINVGARPVVPSLPGLDQVPWLDNDRAMQLRKLPSHLLVVGGGYIGCELGQMYRRFGSAVTIVDHHPRLLAREDPEVSAELEKAFRAEGITLALGAEVESARSLGGDIVLRLNRSEANTGAQVDAGAEGSEGRGLKGGEDLRGSHLLVAVGRRPNTDDLGCAEAGIQVGHGGAIVADDHYRTSAQGVYAVGDVLGSPQFTHTSWDDHRILFEHLMHGAERGRKDRLVPYAVFTDPQVASVGLTERRAREQGIRYEVASMPFGHIARAIEIDEPAGIMKVLLDPATERILGATLVGAEAGELIHIFVALMQAGATARAIVDAEFVHPTFAEGVQSLVMRLPRYALS